MHTRLSLALDGNWDLFLTESGGIATVEGAASTAQCVANECRLFTGDAYFRRRSGIPHFLADLGSRLPVAALLRAEVRRAALRVADVRQVGEIRIEDFDKGSRILSGSVSFTTWEGENAALVIQS
jgi:hypothetical protein